MPECGMPAQERKFTRLLRQLEGQELLRCFWVQMMSPQASYVPHRAAAFGIFCFSFGLVYFSLLCFLFLGSNLKFTYINFTSFHSNFAPSHYSYVSEKLATTYLKFSPLNNLNYYFWIHPQLNLKTWAECMKILCWIIIWTDPNPVPGKICCWLFFVLYSLFLFFWGGGSTQLLNESHTETYHSL